MNTVDSVFVLVTLFACRVCLPALLLLALGSWFNHRFAL
jgi:hypothetical protein